MPAPPLAPGGRHHGARGQPQTAPDQLADHRFPLERVPQALRLVVEHQLVRSVEEPAGAERQVPAVHHALERDHRSAQRAVHDGQLHAPQPVERHLVPGEDALRVGAGLAVERNAEDDVAVRQVVRVVRVEPLGVLQRRDPVHGHPAPFDLVQPDQRRRPPREEIRKARIDPAVPLPLEEGVVGMRIVGLRPDPPLPTCQIAAEPLAGLLLEETDEREEVNEPLARRAQQPRQVPDDAGVGVAPLRAELLERVTGPRPARNPRVQEQLDVGVFGLRRRLGGHGDGQRHDKAPNGEGTSGRMKLQVTPRGR